MPAVPRAKTSPKSGLRRKTNFKFTIDCSAPGGKILDVALFEKFLHDKIKVNGKAGNLGSAVTITRDKSKIVVQTTIAFSKRYLKYLTKKFLKKKKIRDFLRVVATTKNTYELRYFQVADPEALEEDE
ncbi:S60 ribosomal protein L22 [Heterostelium album PN500]|uniref:S60 ribosomal protein L22 n=1 Tax=Heterostelium pallidum (strain ATCC 26659 / Pp 5 / PN500) TaxID=670386 RepID=D3AYE2_HETP5|nr:S60 ribosomal protein L22 [Heterostelium album PN500]EFA85969.1 S60 ribosomal protein L22 [Heterostelium album PN500]|eukprot:XP_020438075.1 S60 ribosomal protein L22 [Heterostelium album PN500]